MKYTLPAIHFLKAVPASTIPDYLPARPNFLAALRKVAWALVLQVFFMGLSITHVRAQVTKDWDRTLGGSSHDLFRMVRQTTDGGYIVGGYSISPASGDKSENPKGDYDFWVVKLNAAGTKEWENTIGGSESESLTHLQQTQDGGYILGGWSFSNVGDDKTENNKGGGDYWIVKLKADGTKEWDKTIGGPTSDYLLSLQQTADGGYILGGESYSGPGADKTEIPRGVSADYWVVKLDAAGNKQWDKTLGGRNYDRLTSVQQTSDGGFIVGGASTNGSGASGDRTEPSRGGVDYWTIKLSATGTIQWEKTLGGLGDDILQTAYQTTDGGYIIGGTSSSPKSGDKAEQAQGYWLVKLNATGGKIWEKVYNAFELQPAPDNGIILGGSSAVTKLDANGNKQWERTYNLGFTIELKSFTQTTDGGFVLGGNSAADAGGFKSENAKGGTDYWVGKFSVSENTQPQTVTFAPIPDKIFGDAPFTLDATASSGLPITYTVVSGPATIAGNVVTLTNVGQVIIRATQPGSADYFSAFAERTFIVRRNPLPAIVCDIALTTKLTQAEPWYGMWGPFTGAGAIDLTVTGGTAPYTYKWNAGLSTQDISAASPGRYSVTVNDTKGCTATTTVYVGRKNDPLTLTTSHINVSDGGVADGSIDLSVQGGVGPFKYDWGNGITTEDRTGLAVGRYFVMVTDAFGQFAFTWVEISETGTTLSLTAAQDFVSTPGGNDAFIDLTVVGGIGPYTYRWNNGATTEDLTRVTGGTYSVTVTDATGATATLSVEIWQPSQATLAATKKPTVNEEFTVKETSLAVYPNPAKDQTTINFTLTKAGHYSLDLYDLRGAKVKTLSQGQAAGNKYLALKVDVSGLAEGVYLLKLGTDYGNTTKRIAVIR